MAGNFRWDADCYEEPLEERGLGPRDDDEHEEVKDNRGHSPEKDDLQAFLSATHLHMSLTWWDNCSSRKEPHCSQTEGKAWKYFDPFTGEEDKNGTEKEVKNHDFASFYRCGGSDPAPNSDCRKLPNLSGPSPQFLKSLLGIR